MPPEFEHILNFYSNSIEKKLSCVLATIVELKGSSYRKPGVRMLFREDGLQLGAISGGCVEKDVWNYSKDIFKTGKSKTISYDGRYRLGCEGIIYILCYKIIPAFYCLGHSDIMYIFIELKRNVFILVKKG